MILRKSPFSQIIFSEILCSNNIHSLHLYGPSRKAALLQLVREREEAGDTLAVFQLISTHLGMQRGKDDIT